MRSLLIASLFVIIAVAVHAQGLCPDVDRVLFPIDTSAFTLVQDYAVRSPRHDGRYHTGEDWTLVNAQAKGQPVRAMANGTVTYAYEQGWGRDGGVVILEHNMPDDTVIYSVYGHMMSIDGSPFPEGNACVSAGDVIGVIGEVAPAPHLHFEIRVNNGRTPGQGYTWLYPNEEGYRRPSQLVLNWQAQLDRTVQWVSNLRNERGYTSPPLVLSDNSLMIANDVQLARILPDGRQLWRKNLDRPVVAVTGFQGNIFVHFNDGIVHQIEPDGTFGDSWRTEKLLSGAPFPLDETIVFPKQGGGLAAVDMRRRNVPWEAASVPLFSEAWVASQVIGFKTPENELVTVSRNGASMLDRAQLGDGADVTVTSDGTLLVYATGGLWRVLADGVWEPVAYEVSLPEHYGAVTTTDRAELLLFDGQFVRNYAHNGVEQWAFEIPDVTGQVELVWLDERALLYSTDGDIAMATPLGKICRVKIWGQPEAYLWHNLGSDGTLRVMIGGSLAGIDWQRFSRDC